MWTEFITTTPAGERGTEATANIEPASATTAASKDAGSATLGRVGLAAGLLGLAAGGVSALAKTRRGGKGLAPEGWWAAPMGEPCLLLRPRIPSASWRVSAPKRRP